MRATRYERQPDGMLRDKRTGECYLAEELYAAGVAAGEAEGRASVKGRTYRQIRNVGARSYARELQRLVEARKRGERPSELEWLGVAVAEGMAPRWLIVGEGK